MRIFPGVVFAAAMVGHLIYTLYLKPPGCGPQPTLMTYLSEGELFIGFSLAIGGAFTAWSLRRFLSSRNASSAAGAAGGTALVAGIAAAGCFFTGCCGSPMLVVYAGLLGGGALEIPKWAMALLALVSTSAGWWWLSRNRGECRCDPASCSQQ